MHRLISTGSAARQISIKNLLTIFVLGIFIVIGIGISGIWANDDTAKTNGDKDSFSYQNAAQAQHARNLAVQAAFQDPEVAEAIARAKMSKDPQDIQDAKDLFHAKMNAFSRHISDLRASGTGWGNIAKQVNVHPSYLGRGQPKPFGKHDFSYPKNAHKKSEIKAIAVRSNKAKDTKGHYGRSAMSMDNHSYSYQNAAQAQHARNLAVQAAFQDPEVAEAIARAKMSKDPNDIQHAKNVFHAKMSEVSRQISDLRASKMGWGNIAQQVNVHPSYLGRGQSKPFGKHHFSYPRHAHKKSEIKTVASRSYKGKAAKAQYGRSAVSKGKSDGLYGAKGSGPSKGRGLALGHGKGQGGGALAGHNAGRGNGHGNGRGNGHGGGHGNGHGGGHGGGKGK